MQILVRSVAMRRMNFAMLAVLESEQALLGARMARQTNFLLTPRDGSPSTMRHGMGLSSALDPLRGLGLRQV